MNFKDMGDLETVLSSVANQSGSYTVRNSVDWHSYYSTKMKLAAERFQERIDKLQARVDRDTETIEQLKSENKSLREEIQKLEKKLGKPEKRSVLFKRKYNKH